jgi:hypothetical protein
MLSIFNSLLWSLHVWFRGKAKIQLEVIAFITNSPSRTDRIQSQS